MTNGTGMRVQLTTEDEVMTALVGKQVKHVEYSEGEVVITFEGDITLYADLPSVYGYLSRRAERNAD